MKAIVFEGCACRAAFHAGVALALHEGGMAFDLAAGASSGSICAVAVAAGRTPELPEVWRSLGGRSIVSLRRALYNRSLFDMSHIVTSTLRARLGDGDLRAHPGEGLIVVTRLRGLKTLFLSTREEPDSVRALLGSCFFPVLYGRHVRLNGELVVDGGLTDNLPIEAVEARGADEIIAVISRADGRALKTPFRERWRPVGRRARVHVIHPRTPLQIRSWDLGADSINRAIDEGHARGREFLGG
ncbi:MAG TPA: patatin-like phospholipase family protein [Kofleriaceae bacterium]|nr:patatin-like phospholipase family protein [Kofleriaceae bacterium]